MRTTFFYWKWSFIRIGRDGQFFSIFFFSKRFFIFAFWSHLLQRQCTEKTEGVHEFGKVAFYEHSLSLSLCSLKVLLTEARGQQWWLQTPSVCKMPSAKCTYRVLCKIVHFAFIMHIQFHWGHNVTAGPIHWWPYFICNALGVLNRSP